MRPLVSVIISTKNEEKNIARCLKSIKDQSYKSLEIIVVDNNSTDNTKEISKKYTNLVFDCGPERSPQRNFGAKKAKGDYLFFIDADMVLSRNVISECVSKTVEKPEIKFLIIPEKSYGVSFWAKCKALEKSFYEGVEWIEGARFFDRKKFLNLGGYNQLLISGEDWDIHSRFSSSSEGDRIKSYLYHNEGDLSLLETIKKKYYYAKKIKSYKKISNPDAYSSQSSVLKRYQLFLSDPVKLFSDPAVGIGMLFMKSCEYLFGSFGYISH